MASIINASTAGVGGVITTADNSGILNIQTAGTTAITVNASQNVIVNGTTAYNNAANRGNVTIEGATTSILNLGIGGTLGGYVYHNGTDIDFRNSKTGAIQFATTGIERMRLDASGNLLVGTTTQADSGKQSVRFNGLIQKGIGIQDSENASGARFISFVGAGGGSIGSIERVGITNAVVYNTTSDLRLKSNIVDADPVLDKLMQVQVRQYDWTEGDLHQDYGFIAQELEPVLTGIVTKGKTEEDMWQLDYSRLTPHLVKALQEQQALIENLTTRLSALENK
jgi:hypothetical protein